MSFSSSTRNVFGLAWRISCSAAYRTTRKLSCSRTAVRQNSLEECNGKCYPQPVSASHPHLMTAGEVTPLVTQDEYSDRRANLMGQIAQLSHKSRARMAVIPAAPRVYMSEKIPYVYRQNSDFFYLTGCLEPDIILVMTSNPGSESFETILFMPKADSNLEMWEGPKVSLDFCLNFLGIHQANYTSHLGAFLSSYIREHGAGCVEIWTDPSRPVRVLDDVLSQQGGSVAKNDVAPITHHLRLVKSKAEQELMRRSCSIIASAVVETMKVSRPLVCESELWATVDYHSRMKGAQHLAYPPVVAGGPRANTIHYISNNQLVQDGDMVLMDAGCQYHGYTSDMTRCWPVNGKFSDRQREAYEAVLDVQLDLIQFCRELPPLDALFQRMCRQLGKNLHAIGFGRNVTRCVERAQMAYSVCPHHVSHYLGLDVHDTGRVKRSIGLLPGMVITIEPGLYVDLNRDIAPKEFHGIGLRIEDDILITETGIEVLTQSCPKTVADIEKVLGP